MIDKINKQKYKFGIVEYDLFSRTFIMGILNVTPDSFSDGGKYFNVDSAVDRALEMVDEGADFIDVGGESTRPGSISISAKEEISRVIPVIKKLSTKINIPISIDTMKSAVAREAIEYGATIVNDISALNFDSEMANVISHYKATAILMHMKGTPQTMQLNPEYDDLIGEIISYLKNSIDKAKSKEIDQIIIDPGIGFGKKLEHNIEILKKLSEFKTLGYPVLIGPSRKSFIGQILNLPVEERLEGTAASVAVSAINGANIVRVHDVREMKRVAQIVDALK